MDNGDEHTYPPGHATIDPNQLNMMENMFQAQMLEMERAVQQLAIAERVLEIRIGLLECALYKGIP